MYLYVYVNVYHGERVKNTYCTQLLLKKLLVKHKTEIQWTAFGLQLLTRQVRVAVSIPAPYESLRRSHGSKLNIFDTKR